MAAQPQHLHPGAWLGHFAQGLAAGAQGLLSNNPFQQRAPEQRWAAGSAGRRAQVVCLGGAPFAALSVGNGPATLPQLSQRSTPDLSGTWIKDKKASESMEKAMSLMHLNGIVRQAVKLIRGLKINHTDTEFTMAVFSFISWFKVRETYKLNGEFGQYNRRDLRRGKHQGRVQAQGRALLLHLTWADPFGGSGTDEFTLVPGSKAGSGNDGGGDQLHVRSTITTADGQASYTTVYKRKDAGKKGSSGSGGGSHK